MPSDLMWSPAIAPAGSSKATKHKHAINFTLFISLSFLCKTNVAVELPFLGAEIAFMQLSVPKTKRSAAAP
jgi:hypothetical protein